MLARKTLLLSVAAIGAVAAITAGAVSRPNGDNIALANTTADTGVATGIRARHIQVSSDVGLHVVERGNPNGTPVVMLHGLSDSWSSFNRVVEFLPGDFRLITIDMRGHGESSKPVGDYSMRTLASDVAAVFDSLQLTRVHVVGHSMGSAVAQHLAAQRANRVQSLGLIGALRGGAYVAGLGELAGAVAEFTDENAPVSDAFARGFQESSVHVPVPQAFLDSTVQASLKLPLHVWKGLMRGMMTDSGPPVRSTVRTMVMWGAKDAFMPRSEQTELVRLYRAPLVQFDSTGHSPHWERPREAARTLVRFFNNEGLAPVQ